MNTGKLKQPTFLTIAVAVAGFGLSPLDDAMAETRKTTPTNTKLYEIPISFGTTNGDILATATFPMGTTQALAVGGNFSSVTLADGTTIPATNFAIFDLRDPNSLLYAASGVNSYVREIAISDGIAYVGGDFTTFDGQSRSRLAAIDTATGDLRSWNPGAASRVEALAANANAVFFGGAGASIKAVTTARSATPGTQIWTKPVTGGAVRVMAFSTDKTVIYVGGLFETLGGVTQHGLVKLKASDGANYATFKPAFRKNSFQGPKGAWDGDCILSLAVDSGSGRIAVGGAGSYRNYLFYINASTGAFTNSAWAVKPSPNAVRKSQGDIQALAIIGDIIAMGYHRGHTNNDTTYYGGAWPTKRNLTFWNKADGSIQTWDAGLYGYSNTNADEGNGGVQAMTYDASMRYLVVAGNFSGYGDPYNNTGGSDIVGVPGTSRPSLAIFQVR